MGEHLLTLRMNDSVRVSDFNHALEKRVTVAPAEVLLVGFDKKSGFVLDGRQSAK